MFVFLETELRFLFHKKKKKSIMLLVNYVLVV